MNRYSLCRNKTLLIIIYIISFLLLFSFIHPTFTFDEEYTIGLIQHSYTHLISINMLDVHPPTYYILLKFFLNVTTFWTNSLFIQVIFGRILSIISLIISFFLLHKLVNESGIIISWKIQLPIYLLLIPIDNYSTTLRMHAFSSLFNILEYVFLVKYNNRTYNKDLIIASVFAFMAIYIDYFSAVCAGIFIVIYFVKYLMQKKLLCSLKFFVVGITLLITSIPIIYCVIRQVQYRQQFLTSSTQSSINLKTLIESFTQSNGFQSIVLFIPFIIIIYWSLFHLNESFNLKLIDIFVNYIITNILSIIVCRRINVYEPKFLYPQFAMYSFFIVSIIIVIYKKYCKSLWKCIINIIIITLCIVSLIGIYKNIKDFIIPSVKFSHKIQNISHIKSDEISLNYNKVPAYWPEYEGIPKQIYVTQESVYLKNLNKKLILINSDPKNISQIVNGKTILLERTFNNLKFK